MSTEPPPSTIKVFLADGVPEGLWIVSKQNWTGKALKFSRNTYKDVRARSEFGLTGVYVLAGEASSAEGQREIYIGEASVVRERLNSHLSKLDFWTEGVVFVATDEFNVSHAKYLEARLLERAAKSKRSVVMNSQPMLGPSLGEADAADMETFLNEMLVVYPIVGISAFEVPRKESSGERFVLKSGTGVKASGQRASDGFLVFEGAIGKSRIQSSGLEYKKMLTLRQELLDSGVLVDDGEWIKLTNDFVFSSPSLAAVLLLGTSASGPQSWITPEGKSLKQVEENEAGSS